MLTHALLVKPDPTPVASAASEPARKAPADDQTYELIGAQVKAHAGHRVEITGTMPSGRKQRECAGVGRPQPHGTPDRGQGTVKTVTMISSTCP